MANFNLNKVILGGNLVADAEIKTTSTGVSVADFRIAIKRRVAKGGAEPQTDFITCQAWRATAEFIAKYFHKGRPICVIGEIHTDNFTDKDGNKRYKTFVSVDEAHFVDSSNSGSAETEQATTTSTPTPAQQAFNAPVDTGFEAISDEDMPF